MTRLFVVFAFIFALSMVALPKSFAALATPSDLTIHTTVLNPQTNSYVDSLGLTDAMYNPGDTIVFHVTVSNSGQSTINMATVDNTFPDNVSFVSGAGTLNSTKKVLSFTLTNIAPKTTKSFAILGKIADYNSLPTNQGVVCLADKATIKTTDGKSDLSSSSFCISKGDPQPTMAPVKPQTKGGIPVNESKPSTIYPANSGLKTTPPTGPEALSFLSIFGSAGLGFLIKRLSKKYTK